MPRSNSILSYEDERVMLEEIIMLPPAEFKGRRYMYDNFSERNQQLWRLMKFRELDRRRNASLYPDPRHIMHGRSEYDKLKFCKINSGPDAPAIDILPNSINIEKRRMKNIKQDGSFEDIGDEKS